MVYIKTIKNISKNNMSCKSNNISIRMSFDKYFYILTINNFYIILINSTIYNLNII